jgi:hypothetical protein
MLVSSFEPWKPIVMIPQAAAADTPNCQRNGIHLRSAYNIAPIVKAANSSA